MDVADIPQSITLTFDDAVTPYTISMIKELTTLVDSQNCGIKATFYVSGRNTVCPLARGLHRGKHEIAVSRKAEPWVDGRSLLVLTNCSTL